MSVAVLIHDSVVKLPAEADGAVVVGGSHAAAYAAYMSAKYGCRAAIHHDAGIGKDEAGVVALEMLQAAGIAAGTVSHNSARIGDARDCWESGVISRCNAAARALGIKPNANLRAALSRLVSP